MTCTASVGAKGHNQNQSVDITGIEILAHCKKNILIKESKSILTVCINNELFLFEGLLARNRLMATCQRWWIEDPIIWWMTTLDQWFLPEDFCFDDLDLLFFFPLLILCERFREEAGVWACGTERNLSRRRFLRVVRAASWIVTSSS